MQTLLQSLASEQDRWFLWIPVVLAGGIAGYFLLPFEPAPWIGVACLFLAGTSLIIMRLVGKEVFSPDVRFAIQAGLLIALFCSLGFAAAQLRCASVAAPVLETPTNVTLQARITYIREVRGRIQLFLENPRMEGIPIAETPRRIRVYAPKSAGNLNPGTTVRLRAKLFPPAEPAVPRGYDFARIAYFEQIGATGYTYGSVHPQETTEQDFDTKLPLSVRELRQKSRESWKNSWARLRRQLGSKIRKHMSKPEGAVATALLTGERGSIPLKVLENFRAAGLSHLLAISGLHMSIVSGMIFIALRAMLAAIPKAALYWPIKKIAVVLAFVAASFYLFLSGAASPAQRSFLMITLVFAALLIDRKAISLRTVAIAATVMLLWTPEKSLNPGFQLSFAATTALVAAWESHKKHAGNTFWHQACRYPIGVLVASAIAFTATAPLAAFHFHRIAPYGLLANLLAVPLTTFWILPWEIIAVLELATLRSTWSLIPLSWGIRVLLGIAEKVSEFPSALILIPKPPTFVPIMAIAAGLWICIWRKKWKWAGVPFFVLALALFFTTRPADFWIDGQANLFAFRDRERQSIWTNSKRETYETRQWMQQIGVETSLPIPSHPSPMDASSRHVAPICIDRDCFAEFPSGWKFAVLSKESRLHTYCNTADVLILRFRSPSADIEETCSNPVLILTQDDLEKYGASTVRLSGHWYGLFAAKRKPSLRTVSAARGVRPWSQRRSARR